jgi:hypothetical protein
MERPAGVTVLATLYIVGASWGVIQISLSALGVEWLGTLHEDISEPIWIRVAPAVARLMLAGLSLILGVGLIRLRRWARRFFIIWCLTCMAISIALPIVLSLWSRRWDPSFFEIPPFVAAYFLVCLWYMSTTRVRRAFGTLGG